MQTALLGQIIADGKAGLAAAMSAGAIIVVVPHEHSPASGLTSANLVVTRLDDPALLHLIEGENTTNEIRL